MRSHFNPCGTLSIVPVCHIASGVIELQSTPISYRRHRQATRSLISIVVEDHREVLLKAKQLKIGYIGTVLLSASA